MNVRSQCGKKKWRNRKDSKTCRKMDVINGRKKGRKEGKVRKGEEKLGTVNDVLMVKRKEGRTVKREERMECASVEQK